jgi:hypothetical protein
MEGSYAITQKRITMSPRTIALVRIESILREILAIFTHHPITDHLGNDRSCRYSIYRSISSDTVVDLDTLQSGHSIHLEGFL